ncbi:MAG: hypothetical protein MJY75_01105 [Bacteroidaceae bacterium]|nr:hypothetical protein [Bacteroidaceae bacterium]
MEFKQSVIEALQCYVYCLVDPRDNKIFYVGKGQGNRVFQHAINALDESADSLKLNTIRDVIKANLSVKYYIIRHGMTKDEALLVESVLIDVLTYNQFNLESVLTNIQSGHHQWDKGVKTIEEINTLYDCAEIVLGLTDRLICININKTYNHVDVDSYGTRDNKYEATRKYWKLNGNRAKQADYVLATYQGIVRAVFKPSRWYVSKKQFESGGCTKIINL